MLYTDLENFYLSKEEPNKSCLMALRTIILNQDVHVIETTKYGQPCFCFKNKMFCFLMVEKKSNKPYMLMVEGKHLDSKRLVTGDRKRMKILMIDPNADIEIELIDSILNTALDLYRNGIIKTKG